MFFVTSQLGHRIAKAMNDALTVLSEVVSGDGVWMDDLRRELDELATGMAIMALNADLDHREAER